LNTGDFCPLIQATSADNARTAWDVFCAEKAIERDMNIAFKQTMPHLPTQGPLAIVHRANRAIAIKNAAKQQVIAMLDIMLDFPNIRPINLSNAVVDTPSSSAC
jgi:hypothetical protein